MFEDIVNTESAESIQDELVELANNIALYRSSINDSIVKINNMQEMLVEANLLLDSYSALHSDLENAKIQETGQVVEFTTDIEQLKSDRESLKEHLNECSVADSLLDDLTSEEGSYARQLKNMKKVLLDYQAKHPEAKNNELMEKSERAYSQHIKDRFELKNMEITVKSVETK